MEIFSNVTTVTHTFVKIAQMQAIKYVPFAIQT